MQTVKCSAITKSGNPCRAYAVGGGELCAGHSGLGFGADPAGSARKRAEKQREYAQERSKGLLERLAQDLDAEAAEIVKTYRAAGRTTDERVGDYRAYGEWITRVYGRPVERVEVGQVDVAGVRELSDAELEELVARGGGLHVVPRTPDVHEGEQTA